MNYLKLKTIPFETIEKVVKNCTTIKNKDQIKKEKIKFIMSFNHDEVKPSTSYYRDLFKQYLKKSDEEIDLKFEDLKVA